MAEVTWFGVEQEICLGQSDDVYCEHPVGIHGERADGCSYIGSSGWCECTFIPDREGAAQLLADAAVIGTIQVPGPPLPAGAGLVGLIPASKTFKADAYYGPAWKELKCRALVKASKGAFRPCKQRAEFQRWVYMPGPGGLHTRTQRQEQVCFTHSRAKELHFEL